MRALRRVVRGRVSVGAALAAALWAGPPSAFAYTWLGRTLTGSTTHTSFGDPVSQTSARTLALGNTNIVNEQSGGALFSNPALLGWLKGSEINLQFGTANSTEDRAYPIFDAFYNRAGETGYISNTNFAMIPAANGAVALGKNVRLGLGYGRAYDFYYEYEEEPREKNLRLISRNTVRTRGGLNSVSGGLAAGVKGFSVGASAHLLRGEMTDRVFFLDANTPANNQETTAEWRNAKGNYVLAGAAVEPGSRWRFGVSYRTKASVEGDWTLRPSTTPGSPEWNRLNSLASEKRTVEYPASWGAGLRYHAQAPVEFLFAAEVQKTLWSNLTSTGGAKPIVSTFPSIRGLVDTTEYRVGLEFPMSGKFWPVRFGFLYQPSYADSEANLTMFTLGSGMAVWKLHLDVGAGFGKREYRSGDIFIDQHGALHAGKPGTPPDSRAPVDTIDEQLAQVLITAKYKF